MAEDNKQNQDSLVEDLGVLSAAGAAGVGAASFYFRMGDNPGKLNDYFIKGHYFFQELGRLWDENRDSLDSMPMSAFREALERANARFDEMDGASANFRLQDTDAFARILEYYKVTMDDRDFLRDRYNDEITRTGIQRLKSLGLDQNSNIYKSIENMLPHLASNLNDVEGAYRRLSSALGLEEYTEASQYVDTILKDMRKWVDDNPYVAWEGNQHTQDILESYKNALKGDARQLLEDQEVDERTASGRISQLMFGKSSEFTYGDMVNIYENGTDEQKAQLRRLFGNSTEIVVQSEQALRKAGFDPTDPEFNRFILSESRMQENVNVLRADDILVHYYKHATAEEQQYLAGLRIGGLRIDRNGRIYSTRDIERGIKDVGESVSSVAPLTFLHTRDWFFQDKNRQIIYHSRTGYNDFATSSFFDEAGQYIEKGYAVIGKHAYELTPEGIYKERLDLYGKGSVVSTQAGMMRRIMGAFSGGELEPEYDESTLLGYLGITAERRPDTIEFGNNADLYGSFTENSYRFFSHSLDTIENQSKRSAEEVYNARKILAGFERYQRFLTKYSYAGDLNAMRSLLRAIPDTGNRQDSLALDYLRTAVNIGDNPQNLEHYINTLLSPNSIADRNFANPSLNMTLRAYVKDPKAALARLNTVADPYALNSGGYISLSYTEQLQQQLLGEFFSRYGETHGFSGVLELIDNNTRGEERAALRRAAAASEYLTRLIDPNIQPDDGTDSFIQDMRFAVQGFGDTYRDTDPDTELFKKTLQDEINTRFGYDFNVMGQNVRGMTRRNIAPKAVVRNPFLMFNSPLDIINDINQGHINRAIGKSLENVYAFGAQFFAGRDDKYFSGASLIGGHLLNRLNDDLNNINKLFMAPFGIREDLGVFLRLGLKSEDATSGGAIFKNLLLKRVLPVYIGYNVLDFADDVLRGVTGTGAFEAGMNGVANIDLGVRKLFDAVGITDGLKALTQDNAVAEYFAGYFGDENPEWKSYEERKRYYERGYNAIRKARFWDFGSSNEFRGGRISYWEPNSWRLASSNYYDESLYNGSFWTKWNPERLFNPYYLEELHYNDRPYPVTGSLFADNTPWGIILNPIIGDAIKPKRLMHQDRLDDSGIDVRAIIGHINSQIRDQARSNENLFYVERGRLRSMVFDAYNAPTPTERVVTVNDDGTVEANDYQTYNTALPINSGIYNELVEAEREFRDPRLSTEDKIAILAARGNPVAQVANIMTGASLDIIRQNNEEIRARTGYGKRQGRMREEKLNTYDPVEQLLEDSETIGELISAGSANDYVQQMAISARMIGGIYGWMLSSSFGFGDNKYERIATSADMDSFSRRFWDSNMGGFGGEFMEIARRVIPEYRRFQTVNPLMNEMPDWLPERFRFGDPYTLVPNGEMRLPGRGWESLHELHPDQFGTYGAFDRFKILADIAPYSPEYKFWKNVVQKTVKDPYLQEEIQEIKDRVAEQSRQHDFQPYKYVGRDVRRQEGIITEVLANGQFRVFGSDETYKLSGVRVKANENMTGQEVLGQYLTPGQKVTMVIDVNEAYARNNDANNTLNAGIIIGGESLAEIMKENGDAVVRKGDQSASVWMTRHGTFVNTLNYLTEAVMHANIPILHNRWMRANDPLEDYLDEYVYGTSFQSWDDFYETFIIPNMRIAASSSFWTAAGIMSDITVNNFGAGQFTRKNLIADAIEANINVQELDRHFDVAKFRRQGLKVAQVVNTFSDRGALMGKLIGKTLRLGQSGQSEFSKNFARRAGSAITLAYSAAVAPENFLVSTMATSRLGWLAGEFLDTSYRKPLAALGAAVGIMRWAGSIQLLAGEDFDEKYIPDSVKERWEMQEYFDRLTYLKYMGLYNAAADEALEEEGVDIRRIIELQDEEARNIKEAKQELEDEIRDIGNPENLRESDLIDRLKSRLKEIKPTQIALRGGEYTRSAIMYYNAARATMYGLDETSSMTDIIRALPKTERDYFMEFVKERDPEKRKEILSYASPSLTKALRIMWYGDYSRPESMEDYFSSHYLPAPTWGGWNPNVDLADVMAKVVKNEAMVASDFGIYSSEYDNPDVINAPELDYGASPSSYITNELKLKGVLNSLGLWGVDVNVSPSEDSMLNVVANIGRVAEYNIGQSIEDIFGGL